MERCIDKSEGQHSKRQKSWQRGPTVGLNETPLHNSPASDLPLESPMNQDSLIRRESMLIGRKVAKAKRGSNSTNDSAKILEQIALKGIMRIERDMKRDADDKARDEAFAREREYDTNKTWTRRMGKPWLWIRAICPLKQSHFGS
ncbi:unnamed protein product [Prunus armeniaca]